MEKFRIISVKRLPGNHFNPKWRLPTDLVETDKGTFISDPRQNNFAPLVEKTVEAYTNISGDFTWISFPMKNLEVGLVHG